MGPIRIVSRTAPAEAGHRGGRQWWLERFSLQEIREMAEAIWLPG
jgi:hypothetical protein